MGSTGMHEHDPGVMGSLCGAGLVCSGECTACERRRRPPSHRQTLARTGVACLRMMKRELRGFDWSIDDGSFERQPSASSRCGRVVLSQTRWAAITSSRRPLDARAHLQPGPPSCGRQGPEARDEADGSGMRWSIWVPLEHDGTESWDAMRWVAVAVAGRG